MFYSDPMGCCYLYLCACLFLLSPFKTLHCWIVQEEIYSKQLEGILCQPQLINMSCGMTRGEDCCSGAQREHSCPYFQDWDRVGSQYLPQQSDDSSPAHSLGYLKCKGSISAQKHLEMLIHFCSETCFVWQTNVEHQKSVSKAWDEQGTFFVSAEEREVSEFSVQALQVCFARSQLKFFSGFVLFFNKGYNFSTLKPQNQDLGSKSVFEIQ